MKSGIVLAVAAALFSVCAIGAASTLKKTEAGEQARKAKKKTAGSTRVAMRSSPGKNAMAKENSAANAASLELYKKALARRISAVDPARVHAEQPQALLRSVVVVRFVIDRNGKLISSAIQRSNRDKVTEQAALASLRSAAPFPKPPANLLKKNRIELLETWLFNTDGRFQMRSIAQAQKSE